MTALTGTQVRISDELEDIFSAMLNTDAWDYETRTMRVVAHAFLYPQYIDGTYIDGVWTEGSRIWQTITTAGDHLQLVPVYAIDPNTGEPSDEISDVHMSYVRPLSGHTENEKRIRVTGKIGKVLKKFLHPDVLKTVSDSTIESVVNACKAYVMADKNGTFTEVKGSDIQY